MPSAETHRKNLLAIFHSALARVGGRACVKRYLEKQTLPGDVYLIAIGKAAAAMAQGALDALGSRIRDGLVITKHGYGEPLPWRCLTSGHPLPDEASLRAGDELLRFVERVPAKAKVLVLLSGGASALVERLPDGVSLPQLQSLNDWLLGAGLDIYACNYVRKRISLIKGGRLAQRLAPRQVLCLSISDVPGDDPATVGSGPLVPDSSAGAEPAPLSKAPDFVRALLSRAPALPGAHDPAFAYIETVIVANLDNAKQAAADAAGARGYQVVLETEFVNGDALVAGARLAQRLLVATAGSLHIWGGETQVTLPPHPGRGGRNQSLALAAALALRDRQRMLFLAAGTDGTDGPGEDAGALIDGDTIARGQQHGLDAESALAQADAGTFLRASGDLLRTGPTGTNVMDLMLGLRY